MNIVIVNTFFEAQRLAKNCEDNQVIVLNTIYNTKKFKPIEFIKKYAIKYIASIYFPLVSKYGYPILINVSEQHGEHITTVSYKVTIELPSLQKIYFTIKSYINSDKVNQNHIYLTYFNPLLQRDLEIISYLSDGSIVIKNDCAILGYLKPFSNHEFMGCQSCKYYDKHTMIGCAVRPGYKKLCDDYAKFKKITGVESIEVSYDI